MDLLITIVAIVAVGLVLWAIFRNWRSSEQDEDCYEQFEQRLNDLVVNNDVAAAVVGRTLTTRQSRHRLQRTNGSYYFISDGSEFDWDDELYIDDDHWFEEVDDIYEAPWIVRDEDVVRERYEADLPYMPPSGSAAWGAAWITLNRLLFDVRPSSDLGGSSNSGGSSNNN